MSSQGPKTICGEPAINELINTWCQRQNDRHCLYDNFKCILLNGICCNLFQISLNIVLEDLFDNRIALVQIMAIKRMSHKLDTQFCCQRKVREKYQFKVREMPRHLKKMSGKSEKDKCLGDVSEFPVWKHVLKKWPTGYIHLNPGLPHCHYTPYPKIFHIHFLNHRLP